MQIIKDMSHAVTYGCMKTYRKKIPCVVHGLM